jgi:hypothetical protein
MRGCEPIVETEHTRHSGDRQAGDEVAMGLDRAGRVAAAVQIEDHAIVATPWSAHPFRTHAAGVHHRVADVAGQRMAIGDIVIPRAQFSETAEFHDGGAPLAP